MGSEGSLKHQGLLVEDQSLPQVSPQTQVLHAPETENSFREGSGALTGCCDGRLLRFRWLALMMEFSADLGSYAHEFEETVLLLDGHPRPAPEQGDLAQVGDLDCPDLIFSYVPKNRGWVSEGHLCDLQ